MRELVDERGNAGPVREMLRRVGDRVLSNCCLSQVRCKNTLTAADDVFRTQVSRDVSPYRCRHVRASDLFLVGVSGGSARAEARLCQEKRRASTHPVVDPSAGLSKRGKYLVVSVEDATVTLGRI
jgi:hypothetical protein